MVLEKAFAVFLSALNAEQGTLPPELKVRLHQLMQNTWAGYLEFEFRGTQAERLSRPMSCSSPDGTSSDSPPPAASSR